MKLTLSLPRKTVSRQLSTQISAGQKLRARLRELPGKEDLPSEILSDPYQNALIQALSDFVRIRDDYRRWDTFNIELLEQAFSDATEALQYQGAATYLDGSHRSYTECVSALGPVLHAKIEMLTGLLDKLVIIPESTIYQMASPPRRIFIGHGGSSEWRKLDGFLEKLGLPREEFNRISPAGVAHTERLSEMLGSCGFAFLVFTAEDQAADGSFHARANVIHEAGLFQGRYGFKRAIILLEEGCEEFSNINGLGHIPFPKGNLHAASESIRDVLVREKVLSGETS